MKKINGLLFFSVAMIVLFVFGLNSCGKMDDTYRQFLKGGEITYVAKADSIKISPGRNRVEITWLLLSDPKVTSYKVYWNNHGDSIENRVEKTEMVDTVSVEIDNLAEGNQTFEIYTYDDSGHSSVKAEVSGKVYGDLYESSLLNATISEFVRQNSDLMVVWNENQPEGVSHIELEYTDAGNKIVKKDVFNLKDTTVLTQFPVGGSFQYRTGFLPDSLAIDTFYATYSTIKTD